MFAHLAANWKKYAAVVIAVGVAGLGATGYLPPALTQPILHFLGF